MATPCSGRDRWIAACEEPCKVLPGTTACRLSVAAFALFLESDCREQGWFEGPPPAPGMKDLLQRQRNAWAVLEADGQHPAGALELRPKPAAACEGPMRAILLPVGAPVPEPGLRKLNRGPNSRTTRRAGAISDRF